MIKLTEVFIFENNLKELPWKTHDEWWQDSHILFHGTQDDVLEKIEKSGFIKAGPGSKGYDVYFGVDPLTARGYASMRGGESRFKKQKTSVHVPMNERVVLVIEIPKNELKNAVLSKQDTRLKDKESWEANKNNPRYWELAEVVYPKDIPISWIKGYMKKV